MRLIFINFLRYIQPFPKINYVNKREGAVHILRQPDKGGMANLEKLLTYHQRLVVENGLQPSRLMEEHTIYYLLFTI